MRVATRAATAAMSSRDGAGALLARSVLSASEAERTATFGWLVRGAPGDGWRQGT